MYSYLALTLILSVTISSAVSHKHHACPNKQSKYRIDMNTLYKTVCNIDIITDMFYEKYRVFGEDAGIGLAISQGKDILYSICFSHIYIYAL